MVVCLYLLITWALWENLPLVLFWMCAWILVLLSNYSAYFYVGICREWKTAVDASAIFPEWRSGSSPSLALDWELWKIAHMLIICIQFDMTFQSVLRCLELYPCSPRGPELGNCGQEQLSIKDEDRLKADMVVYFLHSLYWELVLSVISLRSTYQMLR